MDLPSLPGRLQGHRGQSLGTLGARTVLNRCLNSPICFYLFTSPASSLSQATLRAPHCSPPALLDGMSCFITCEQESLVSKSSHLPSVRSV